MGVVRPFLSSCWLVVVGAQWLLARMGDLSLAGPAGYKLLLVDRNNSLCCSWRLGPEKPETENNKCHDYVTFHCHVIVVCDDRDRL